MIVVIEATLTTECQCEMIEIEWIFYDIFFSFPRTRWSLPSPPDIFFTLFEEYVAIWNMFFFFPLFFGVWLNHSKMYLMKRMRFAEIHIMF